MANRISINLFLKNKANIIEEWFKKMKYFAPTSMLLELTKKQRKFGDKNFFLDLLKEISKDKFSMYYHDGKNRVSCHKSYENIDSILLSAVFEKEVYDKNKEEIYLLINNIMVNFGIDGRIVDSTDDYWQHNIFLRNYDTFKKSSIGIPLKINHNNTSENLVDVEKMPGYAVDINNVWHGAAWKMWFNKPYYEYVAKEVIENYKDCYKNEKLSNDCFCITLYENMEDYDKPENRELQWKFKKAINFDELLRKVKEIESRNKKKVDPEIELETGEFENGGKRRKITYLNDVFEITHKSKATQAEIIEYDGNGKFIWQGMKKIEELK